MIVILKSGMKILVNYNFSMKEITRIIFAITILVSISFISKAGVTNEKSLDTIVLQL